MSSKLPGPVSGSEVVGKRREQKPCASLCEGERERVKGGVVAACVWTHFQSSLTCCTPTARCVGPSQAGCATAPGVVSRGPGCELALHEPLVITLRLLWLPPAEPSAIHPQQSASRTACYDVPSPTCTCVCVCACVCGNTVTWDSNSDARTSSPAP